jgi:exodeoxyribonuclease VII large subunit
MTEELNGRKIFSLLEVTQSIQKTIATRYKTPFWVKAEMNKLNFYQHSGHCYPELVEKREGKIISQIRGNLWREDYIRINAAFEQVLNEPLKDGIKILFLATVTYHPEYGLALRIIDIDPGFTLGDLEREKQETIKKLREEGIFNKNRTLSLPALPQRIAIISVETSKGYVDFLHIFELANATWGYHFFHLLFPSLLQGDKAVSSILHQLGRIRKAITHFDVVVIVRGGGGDTGLSCYNNYELAKEIALFPIPVMTGIGHATNETVAEMIAYENAITPTKLAEFLIQKFHNFSVPVQKAREKIVDRSARLVTEEKTRLRSAIKLFRSFTRNILAGKKNDIKEETQSLMQHSRFLFKNQAAELINLEKNVNNMSLKNVMKRGFSITLLNGKAVRSPLQVKEGDLLNTEVYEGIIVSTVKSTSKPTDNE